MINVPDQVKTASHRLVSSMYKKLDYNRNTSENVLIIEASFPDPDDEGESFDFYLLELLEDLGALKAQAEHAVGKIDRIDIRAH
jgi:hypothetical protein